MDCIFCKIISGEISCKKLYESDSVIAFLDAFPLAAGHCLVIPKKHYPKIQDMPSGVNTEVFDVVHKLVSKVDSLTSATLLAIHNGQKSGQEIPHVHVHLIPRESGDGAGAVHSMFKNNKPVDSNLDSMQEKLSLMRE